MKKTLGPLASMKHQLEPRLSRRTEPFRMLGNWFWQDLSQCMTKTRITTGSKSGTLSTAEKSWHH